MTKWVPVVTFQSLDDTRDVYQVFETYEAARDFVCELKKLPRDQVTMDVDSFRVEQFGQSDDYDLAPFLV